MQEQLDKIRSFHEAFGVKNGDKPRLLDPVDYLLRHDLMAEENAEYLQACQDGNIVEVADALGDKLVILLGTIQKHGLHDLIVPIFDAIHENNMSKLDENGKPIINGENDILDVSRPLGKILKPHNYRPVDLKPFFENDSNKS